MKNLLNSIKIPILLMFHLLSSCSDSRLQGTWVCDARPQGAGIITLVIEGTKVNVYYNGGYYGVRTVTASNNNLRFVDVDKSIQYGTLTSPTSMVIRISDAQFFYYKTANATQKEKTIMGLKIQHFCMLLGMLVLGIYHNYNKKKQVKN